jgi:quinol monooxygenase YgiN
MYARSTTVHGKPAALEVGIAYVREAVMPTVRDMEGCVGISMLADRESGRSVITTSWSDWACMHRSAQFMQGVRRRTAEILVGPLEVHEWEIAVLHRRCGTRHGARTRVVWTQGDPAHLDHLVDRFRMTMVSRLEELPGFCNVSVLVDRVTGRSATAVTYENSRAMEEASEQAAAVSRQLTESTGMEIVDAASFDLELARLRVPETV